MRPEPFPPVPPAATIAPRRFRPNRLTAAIFAGLVAGTVATVVEIVLWQLFTGRLSEVLVRDANLAAAIVLGPGSLSSLESIDRSSLAVATLVHFALSIAYALVLSWFVSRTRLAAAVVGTAFGLGLFALNLYGFARLFPWFVVARDPITLAAHIVFGVAAALVLRRCRVDAYEIPTSWPAKSEA
jgi:hypothetical protein